MGNRRERDEDLDREIRMHLELEAEEQQAAGLSVARAGYAARRAFGNATLIGEEIRAMGTWNAVEGLWQDLRHGARLLRRSPAFTAFTVASLALGIGAVTAIFSLFNAIVLRHLPVQEPDRLVVASFTNGGKINYSMPYPQFARMRELGTSLSGLFAVYPIGRVSVGYGGHAELAEGLYATGDYHQVLGLTPALGRLLVRDDDRPGKTVAVISYAYWQRRFGGSPEVVGANITINQAPFQIIGVEPRGFAGVEVGRVPDIIFPMRTRDLLAEGKTLWDEAFSTWIYVVGRLKSGVSLEQAHSELNVIARQTYVEAARSASPRFRPDAERIAKNTVLRLESAATGAMSDLRQTYQRWLSLLLWLLGAVLLLASLNVAALLLARSEARHREIVMRLAIGAGRWRIVRQLLTESILLAALGGALGVAVAWWAGAMLLRLATSAAGPLPVDPAPNIGVTAFVAGVSLLTCLVFGLPPALRTTSRGHLVAARETGGRRKRLLDRTLVASQVALSVALLVCAGLFLRSLGTILARDTGYDRANVLLFSVDAKLAGRKGPEVSSAYRRILNELGSLPGARTASISAVRPVSDSYYFVESVSHIGGKQVPDDQRIKVAYNDVGPGYFATLGIPLLAGRDFDDRDSPAGHRVVIVSEKMARHIGGNPIGQTIALHSEDVLEVVGVARNASYARVKDEPREVIYLPIFQSDPKNLWYAPTFEIRYAGTLAEVLRSVRGAVARVDPGMAVFGAKTLEVQTAESLSRERLLALLTSYGGSFALLLACIGLYGLMNYAVVQRMPELGLRMALGARPAALQWLVLRESLLIVLAGVVAGLAGSVPAVRLIRSQLLRCGAAGPAVAGWSDHAFAGDDFNSRIVAGCTRLEDRSHEGAAP